MLQKCLGWKVFDEEDDTQRSIELDYLYDHFMYTLQHGFPWTQICAISTITQYILQASLGKYNTIFETDNCGYFIILLIGSYNTNSMAT